MIRLLQRIRLLVILLLLFMPVAVFGLYAFSTAWFYPDVLPRTWTAAPLLRQLHDPGTTRALLHSTSIGLVVSLLALVVGYPAARTLGMQTFRGKELVYLLLFLPTVVPPVATGIGLNILFLRLDLAGTTLGVALVHLIPVLPYVIFTLAGVFAQYDPHYEYQARVLGAGDARIFWSVTLPFVLPGVVVATLFAFLISWSQYLLTLLIGGGRIITLPILLFATLSGGNPTTISVLSLLFVAPLVLILAVISRFLATLGSQGAMRRHIGEGGAFSV
ncbi:MAG TPA: ABC transporter permease subunit [Herpetosiphonaceae bacterium]|nr:ABC transporter permease subunit [Herpetosiphonaceae bacterium]